MHFLLWLTACRSGCRCRGWSVDEARLAAAIWTCFFTLIRSVAFVRLEATTALWPSCHDAAAEPANLRILWLEPLLLSRLMSSLTLSSSLRPSISFLLASISQNNMHLNRQRKHQMKWSAIHQYQCTHRIRSDRLNQRCTCLSKFRKIVHRTKILLDLVIIKEHD